MCNLQSLIERVEKASGPDSRSLIHAALILAHKSGWLSDGKYDLAQSWNGCGAYLDAVMALMPKGLEYNITNIYGIAHVDVGINVDDQHSSRREDGNITLALLSAILKSRLATNGGGVDA